MFREAQHRQNGSRPAGALLAVALASLALAACGGEAPVPQPTPAASAAATRQELAGPERLVLAFGDSLYAGYQLKPNESYPAQLEQALRKRGINAMVINAGVSGDTTAAGRQRLAFTLNNLPRTPDLALVGLGGNDMLRGLPPAEARGNLDAILSELDRRGIPIVLTGMLAAPNLGEGYVSEFNRLYPDLAREYDAALVPFFLAPVIGRPGLMLPDHVHPTAEGVAAIVGATVDEVAGALPAPATASATPSPR